MSKHNVVELTGREKIHDELTELIRDGARELIAQDLNIEVSELLSALSDRRDGKPVSFRSALVPPYVRKTASLEAALP